MANLFAPEANDYRLFLKSQLNFFCYQSQLHTLRTSVQGHNFNFTFKSKFNNNGFMLQCVMMLEDVTRMVSALDLFSRNESIEEVSTQSVKFFLLPFLLGNLNAKLSNDLEQV